MLVAFKHDSSQPALKYLFKSSAITMEIYSSIILVMKQKRANEKSAEAICLFQTCVWKEIQGFQKEQHP